MLYPIGSFFAQLPVAPMLEIYARFVFVDVQWTLLLCVAISHYGYSKKIISKI